MKFSLRKCGDRFNSENIGRPINQALERFQHALAHVDVHFASKCGIALGLQKLAAAQHRNQAEKEIFLWSLQLTRSSPEMWDSYNRNKILLLDTKHTVFKAF